MPPSSSDPSGASRCARRRQPTSLSLGLALAALLIPSTDLLASRSTGAPGKARKSTPAASAAAPTTADAADAGSARTPAPPAAVATDGGATLKPALSPEELARQVDELVAQLPSRDKEIKRNARARIIAIGRDATPTLLTHFKSDDFTTRWEMANIQGDIRDDRAIPALVENVLHDVDPHVRWRSIWALNEFPGTSDHQTITLLKEAMASEDWVTRWNAAVGLSMFGQRACLPVLEKGISDTNDWRRWEAIGALGRINDEKSPALLGPILQSGTSRERSQAVLSLGKMRYPAAVDLLIAALGDADPGVRWRACMSLGLTGDPRAVAALEAVKKNDTDGEVLRHAGKALDSLGRPRPERP